MPFEDYRKLVDKHTASARYAFVIKDGEELDHRLQVKLAHRLNINPKTVATKNNLRVLKKEFNASRQDIPDTESVNALNDLIEAKLLDESYLPRKIKKIDFFSLPQVKEAISNLSIERPHAQVYVPIDALASIDPIENQRKHESRYHRQLEHFECTSIRPKHTKFTVVVWKDGKKICGRLNDGNTRKHNILNHFLHLMGIQFPEEIAVDIEFAENQEQALKDSLLHDAMGAGKSHVDLSNGIRREHGLLDGILIKKIDDGTSLTNIIYTSSLNTKFAMRNKADMSAAYRAFPAYYMDVLTVVNRFVALGEQRINKPEGVNDWHIAAAVMMWRKYGEKAADAINERFEYIRVGHELGDRDYGVFADQMQPIGVIYDELYKFNYKDLAEVEYVKSKTILKTLPRRVMENSNSDGNVAIYTGLLLYGMISSMNKKQINEDLYLEFLPDVSTYTEKEEATLRARSVNIVEAFFNEFWNS